MVSIVASLDVIVTSIAVLWPLTQHILKLNGGAT
jgi:hypothetical protein